MYNMHLFPTFSRLKVWSVNYIQELNINFIWLCASLYSEQYEQI